MKIIAKVVIIILLINSGCLLAQNKYNIDAEQLGNRRLDVSYFIFQTKQNWKIIKEDRKKHRLQNKSSKATRKHTYNIQTKEVRKRMKKSEKKADHFNEGTVPFKIKLKKKFSWMILVK